VIGGAEDHAAVPRHPERAAAIGTAGEAVKDA
jgi:hypothetical protein